MDIDSLKIGIIGGGIMGRLLLNSLLVFTKDGLYANNISISTRQTDNLMHYHYQFGVRVLFDNDLVAEESDILIVATPATLDNWIVVDLKQALNKRIAAANWKTLNKSFINYSAIKKITPYTNRINVESNLDSKAKTTINYTGVKKTYNPLVIVLVSDLSKEKCYKLFNFPLLMPAVRAYHIEKIYNMVKNVSVKSQHYAIEAYEYILANWMINSPNNNKYEKLVYEYTFTEYTPLKQLIKLFRYIIAPSMTTPIVPMMTTSVSNTTSVKDTIKSRYSKDYYETLNLTLDVMGRYKTYQWYILLKNCRKWRMAYTNFIL